MPKNNNLKDFMTNEYLQLKNNIRYLFKVSPKKFKSEDPSFEDNFTDFSNWNRRLWWGSYSRDEKYCWMDENQTSLVKDGVKVSYQKLPKVNTHTGETMEWATGLLESKNTFKQGYYEVICQIYPGEGVWHAPLWFVTKGRGGDEFTVLPEPDVCEFYTEGDVNKYKPQTNFHFGKSYEKGEHLHIGAKTHRMRNVYKRDISFAMEWKEDYIKFYYDGHLVRKVTNKLIMDNMKDQLVIIGAGVRKGENNKYAKEGGYLLVKSFKYWEL